MIVVTGATGKLGSHIIEELLAKLPANELMVAVRNPDAAAALRARGVGVRPIDYRDPSTLEPALRGATQLLFMSSSDSGAPRMAQHRAVVDAAKRAGVRLIVYTSMLHADRAGALLARDHSATEELIRASEIPFVFLRNGWYIENYTENLAAALQRGAFLGCAGEGRIAAATRADYAAAAAAVLASAWHENTAYELAGDIAFTMRELAAEVSRQTGKPIAYTDLPAAQYEQVLVGAGVPADKAAILADADRAVARGELDDRSGELRRLIGRPTTPLAAAILETLRAA